MRSEEEARGAAFDRDRHELEKYKAEEERLKTAALQIQHEV